VRDLPERLVVIGCGPVGSEFAQAFARLGSRVTQVEFADRMLPQEDPDISALMTAVFDSEGVEQIFGAGGLTGVARRRRYPRQGR
jgi:pyruvate/2-oxoglutarate dehydrogenase complex dihydrolipoamide dehydrogenase (E3) component